MTPQLHVLTRSNASVTNDSPAANVTSWPRDFRPFASCSNGSTWPTAAMAPMAILAPSASDTTAAAAAAATTTCTTTPHRIEGGKAGGEAELEGTTQCCMHVRSPQQKKGEKQDRQQNANKSAADTSVKHQSPRTPTHDTQQTHNTPQTHKHTKKSLTVTHTAL